MSSPKERRYPEGNVHYRRLNRSYSRALRGERCWVYDDQGRRYLDACGGAYVASLGHGVREIADAMAEQARRLAYVNATAFTHEPAEELAAELASLCPPGLDKAYFLCNGGDAVEAALKLARQYWVESGRSSKHKILSLKPGYHGTTLLAISVSTRAGKEKFFPEWLLSVRSVPAPYAYRCPCGGKPPLCGACSGAALERAIEEEGPETVAAFIYEPVGGSSAGATVPPDDYHRAVRAICDRHRVLMIADEVLCGAGRTGTWSALEPSGAVPDMLVLGKGITGGYAPLSALMAPRRILDPLARGYGSLLHNQTFSFHPVSCAAGLAAVRMIKEKKLVRRAAELGAYLHKALERLRGLPHVGDVRGRGLLACVEFVEDKKTRRPLPKRLNFAETFFEAARAAGLLVWPNSGQLEGGEGDLALLAPPYVASKRELDRIVELFEAALKAAARHVTATGRT